MPNSCKLLIVNYQDIAFTRFCESSLAVTLTFDLLIPKCNQHICEPIHLRPKLGEIPFIYSVPVGQRSIAISLSVCLSVRVSVREHISGTAGQLFTKCFVEIPCDRGSVLLRRRCDTLCTSGFMDDVTLAACDIGAEYDVYECLVLTVTNSIFMHLLSHQSRLM